MKRILVLECGLGFGGALTSLASFLEGISGTSAWEFHVLTAYPQMLIRPGGAVRRVGVLPRKRLYGPHSRLEKTLQSVFRHRAGNAAFLLDMLSSGFVYSLQVAKYIRHHRIDLVHLNNGTLINDAGIIGAKLAGVPCVVHVRGPEYVGGTSSLLAKMVDHFMPVSEFIQETVTAMGVPGNRVTVVYEGLDADVFASRADGSRIAVELNLPRATPVIGMVGCMVPWKGHAVFLDACRQVLEHQHAMILIAGDAPDNKPFFRQTLERKAIDLGIGDHVRFLGHRSDVASVMDACDIIVHASTAPEPFGRVIIEAMALKKAVIATQGGGPAEIIEDRHDGLIVPPGDGSAMASAVEYLIHDPVSLKKMAVNGHQKAITSFSIERHITTVKTVYHRFFSS